MTSVRLAAILPIFIASLSACASRRPPYPPHPSSATGTGRRTVSCTLESNSWLCSPFGFSMGTVTLTGPEEITMPSGSPGQLFTIRVAQDSKGGHVPTWDSIFMFPNSNANYAHALVPLSFPNASEYIQFQYDDAAVKWVYLSRSGVQQIAPTIQGAGTSIGDHPGRVSSAKALFLPANTETGVFGDNGGFFGPESNGVVSFYQIQSGVIQFCNFDAITTLAVFRCNTSGNWPSALAQTAPVQVPAGSCTQFPVQMVATGNPATRVFTGYVCYINPGNSAAAYATWNSIYNEEIPSN
jgi:hypothetical protein